LAKKLKVTVGFISNIETGKKKISLSKLLEICKALKENERFWLHATLLPLDSEGGLPALWLARHRGCPEGGCEIIGGHKKRAGRSRGRTMGILPLLILPALALVILAFYRRGLRSRADA
jgi:transcriptional regulator with XRE-family HTH domain